MSFSLRSLCRQFEFSSFFYHAKWEKNYSFFFFLNNHFTSFSFRHDFTTARKSITHQNTLHRTRMRSFYTESIETTKNIPPFDACHEKLSFSSFAVFFSPFNETGVTNLTLNWTNNRCCHRVHMIPSCLSCSLYSSHHFYDAHQWLTVWSQ